MSKKPIPQEMRSYETFTYFNLFFDVGKALEFAKNYAPKNRKPKYNFALPMVRTDDDYYMKTDIKSPLIFAYVKVKNVEGYILIDGHHRLRKALELKKWVKCIYLSKKDSLKVRMTHDEYIMLIHKARKVKEGVYVTNE